MGLFLSSIQVEKNKFEEESATWKEPLQKLKEYHGMFKSVCDSFIINKQQFIEIFGKQDKIAIWDKSKDNSPKINALQLFAGLIYFSIHSQLKEKIKFLFAIFDFNEIKSISFVDLQCMILGVCNSVYNILGKNAKANAPQIAQWLAKQLPTKQRITITQLYKFLIRSPQFEKFVLITLGKTARAQVINTANQFKRQNKSLALDIPFNYNSLIKDQYEWYKNFSQKIVRLQQKEEINYGCQVNWVYGFKSNLSKPFVYVNCDTILYSTSSVMVIYMIKLNKQHFYLGHKRQIASFCYDSIEKQVASVQISRQPQIHLWDLKTRLNKKIIRSLHPLGIQFMEFLSNLKLLITIGKRQDSPIIIYNSETCQVKYSFFVTDRVKSIIIPHIGSFDYQSEAESNQIIAICSYKAYLIAVKEELQISSFDLDATDQILCGTAVYISVQNPQLRAFQTVQDVELILITGHANGQVRMINMSKGFINRQVLSFGSKISHIYISNQMFITCSGSQLAMNSFQALYTGEPPCRLIDISAYPDLKLIDNEISYFNIWQNSMLLMTNGGDFIKVADRQIYYEDGSYKQKQNLIRINTLAKFEIDMKTLCLVQRNENQYLLFCVSDNKKILGINHQNHEIEDVWDIKQQQEITVIDAVYSDEGINYLICGCKSGKLYIRIDWEEIPKLYDCSAEIIDLKLSHDCSYLIVATDNHVHLFTHVNRNFSSPRKIKFQNEIPICLNFLDNYKFFTVNTSAKNIYLIEIPQMKHNNIMKQNERLNISKLEAKFPYFMRDKTMLTTQALFGGSMKYYILTVPDGRILFYQSYQAFNQNSYVTLRLHQNSISKILTIDNQSRFYTMGKYDKTIVQWKVFQNNQIYKIPDGLFVRNRYEEWKQKFNRISSISKSKDQTDEIHETYLFRGTKQEKLNQSLFKTLHKQKNFQDQKLQKRASTISLKPSMIYGIQPIKHDSIAYINNGDEIVYYCSKYLIKMEAHSGRQTIIQPSNKKISCIAVKYNKIFTAQAGEKPKIHVLPDVSLETTHENGIISLTVQDDYVLSYGVTGTGYSINLHNYNKRQFLKERLTNFAISSFVMVNIDYFISLNQLRVWNKFTPSEQLGYATCGTLMPNGKDICLGTQAGDLIIINQKGIFTVNSGAHQQQIVSIKVKYTKQTYQLVTISNDEKIKIWNENFKCITQINIRNNPEMKIISEDNKIVKSNENLKVNCMDVYGRKILFCLQSSEVYEAEIEKEKLTGQKQIKLATQSEIAIDSQFSLNQSISMMEDGSKRIYYSFKLNWRKVVDFHYNPHKIFDRKQCVFSVHPGLPIIVSAGTDCNLIVHEFQQDKLIAKINFQNKIIKYVKFAPNGRLLAVGLQTGEVFLYYFEISRNKQDYINSFVLNLSQTFHHNCSQILKIEFSKCTTYFAVSYAPRCRVGKVEDESDWKASVIIYKSKQQKLLKAEQKYFAYERTYFSTQDCKKNSKFFKGVYYMSFCYADGHLCLALYEQFFNENNIRVNGDNKAKVLVYMLEENILRDEQFSFDWLDNDFPNLIQAQTLEKNTFFNRKQQKKLLTISSMLIFNDIFYGDVYGNLHIVKLSSLQTNKPLKQYLEEQKCLSRFYKSHVSFINQIQLSFNKKYLFVSGATDQCIVKYEIGNNDAFDLDNTNYQLATPDIHNQYAQKEVFYDFLNNIYPLRQQVSDILKDVQISSSDPVGLKVHKIFGRRAFDRRNNIFHDGRKSLVYGLGPNIIVQSTIDSFDQYYIPGSPSPTSHSPQISCFHVSGNHLILATEQQVASVYIWDIHSKSCIGEMKIDTSIVYHIKMLGNSHAVLYGINQHYQPKIQIINWKESKIQGGVNMMYSAPWKIKDMCTFPNKHNFKRFITCGVQHLCLWQMRGENLIYESFKGQFKNLSFMAVASDIKDTVITGCQKGFLYIWKNFSLAQKINMHNATIRSLALFGTQLFSGGMDGTLVKNQLQTVGIDQRKQQKRKICKQQHPDPNTFLIQSDIQSITIQKTGKYIYVGTRSGDIYEINQQDKSQKQILSSHDNQLTVSVAFDKKYGRQRMFSLTQAGQIQSWCLKKLQKEFTHRLGKKSQKIFALDDQLLLVCCDKSIVTLNIQGNSMKYIEQLSVNFEGSLTDCVLSRKRNRMVVSVNLNQSNSIIVYKISDKLQELFRIVNLKYQIQYLDFSVDQNYVLFKDKFQQLGMIDLETKRRINTIFVEMNIQWQSQGIRISPKGQQIYCSYSRENKITTIARLTDKHILVGDQMGTLRIFQYPCPQNRIGQLHEKCYNQHMNYIKTIQLHPNLMYAVTISLYDRSMILWKINQ